MIKHDKFEVTILGIVAHPKRGILIIKRSPNKYFLPGHWEGIGGHMESHETIEDCLNREAKEEVGIDIKLIKPINAYAYKIGDRGHIEIVYLCETKSEAIKLSSEHSKHKWIKNKGDIPKDISEKMKSNIIHAF